MKRADELRELIIDQACVDLFGKGQKGLKIDSLCAVPGISKKTFYEIFHSKEHLIELSMERTFAEHQIRVRKIMHSRNEPLKKLFGILKYYLNFIYRIEPDYLRLLNDTEKDRYIVSQIRDFWVTSVKRSLDMCSDFIIRGFNTERYSRFLLESINGYRYKKIPLYAAPDMIFYLMRGCLRPESMDRFKTIYQDQNCKFKCVKS